jgi:hypothetical protein
MNDDVVQITTLRELAVLASKVGVIYFQVYAEEPNPEFYRNMPALEPYERIVEIRSDAAPKLQGELEFKGHVPFFGSVAGGWPWGVTDKPDDVSMIVVVARKHAVLPGSIGKKSDDENITLEGLPPRGF